MSGGLLGAYLTWVSWFGEHQEDNGLLVWGFLVYMFVLAFLGMFAGHYTWLFIARKVFSQRELEIRAGLEGLVTLMAVEEEVGPSEGLKKGQEPAIEMIIGRSMRKTDDTSDK